MGGDVVFPDAAQLAQGALMPVNRTEYGALVDPVVPLVWTGTLANGTSAGQGSDCVQWYDATVDYSGLTGDFTAVGSGWTDTGFVTCDTPAHFYCFEQ